MSEGERIFTQNYLNNQNVPLEERPWDFIRLALASTADTAITQSEFLCLDGSARINHPSTLGDNWKWRLLPGQITQPLLKRMRDLSSLYGRVTG